MACFAFRLYPVRRITIGGTPKQIISGTLEAQLQDRSDIIYYTDFENEDWHDGWKASDEGDNTKNFRLVDMGTMGAVKAFKGKAQGKRI